MCGGPRNATENISRSSLEKKIAVIGTDIDALLIAWNLSKNQDYLISIFPEEGNDNLSKHDTKRNNVDVCFVNSETSSYLGKVLKDLDLSPMSTVPKRKFLDQIFNIGFEDDKNILSWSPASASQTASSMNIFGNEINRFHNDLVTILNYAKDDPRRNVKICEFVETGGYNDEFMSGYLIPLLGGNEDTFLNYSVYDVLKILWRSGLLIGNEVNDVGSAGKLDIVNMELLKMKLMSLLEPNLQLSAPVVSIKKSAMGTRKKVCYELFSQLDKSLGEFGDLILTSSSANSMHSMLENIKMNDDLSSFLLDLKHKTNSVDVHFHKDKECIPKGCEKTVNWVTTCGKKVNVTRNSVKKGEAMEGGESGFGNKAQFHDKDQNQYSIFYNFDGILEEEAFISVNPTKQPNSDLSLSHTKVVVNFADPVPSEYQGNDGLHFSLPQFPVEGNGILFRYEKLCENALSVVSNILEESIDFVPDSENEALSPKLVSKVETSALKNLWNTLTYTLPVTICKQMIFSFLNGAIKKGILQLKFNDGSIVSFGSEVEEEGVDKQPVVIRVFDDWFFVKTALEYDLGMARSYMCGYFTVEGLTNTADYDQTLLWPTKSAFETNSIIGDPIGLTRLFLLFIKNRDATAMEAVTSSATAHKIANSLSNASGLFVAKIGSFINYLRYKMTMDNSEKGGSLKNIHAHYDLSNDLFRSFLDKETLMYSSAIYDAVTNPVTNELMYKGTLEEAQWRKLDTLLARAQMTTNNLQVLDIGFGWGGLSLHAARKYNARVHGITLSVEQMALARERVKKEGLEHLITFEVIDYRTFAKKKENQKKFDRVLSCEMIEAVGHEHLGEFYESVEKVLTRDGVLVMEAITTPEERYEVYRRSTDLINTIIFPGSCCPSLHALMDAAYKHSTLTLEHVSNIGQHYARTLAEWRRRFNKNEAFVRRIGFDSVFMRVWNYYLTYCEAAFYSRTENCLILVFARPGCSSLVAINESREVCQAEPLTAEEAEAWIQE